MEISVVIPVYNAEQYLETAVNSALQFQEVKEIILIEDDSPDNALLVCKELVKSNSRVQLFQHEGGVNKGAGASRNLGVKMAKCEYVSFLDADDKFLPNRFESELEMISNGKTFEVMYGALGIYFYSDEAQQKYASHFSAGLTVVRDFNVGDSMFEELLGMKKERRGHIHLNTLTIRKDVLDRMPFHFNEKLRLHQDLEFIIRLSYYAKVFPGVLGTAIALRGVHMENRYTKVAHKTKKHHFNQILVWESLKKWGTEEKIPKVYLRQISRYIYSYKIASTGFFNSWLLFLMYTLKDIQLLKSYKIYLKNMLMIN